MKNLWKWMLLLIPVSLILAVFGPRLPTLPDGWSTAIVLVGVLGLLWNTFAQQKRKQ